MWAATPRNREVARVLRAEVADDGAGLECMVCMERPRAIRHQCGHATLCEGCNETYMRQPNPTCLLCERPLGGDSGEIVSLVLETFLDEGAARARALRAADVAKARARGRWAEIEPNLWLLEYKGLFALFAGAAAASFLGGRMVRGGGSRRRRD